MMKSMGRIVRCATMSLALGSAAGLPAVAAESAGQLPPAVAKAVAELVYACRAAGEPVVAPSAYINAADIDGDRITDYVVDVSKGCPANKKARCTADGCAIDVHLSSKQGATIALRGTQSSIEVASGQASVKLVRAGAECQSAQLPDTCREELRYSDGSLSRIAR